MKNYNLTELSKEEMVSIDGGVRWGDTIVKQITDFIVSLF